MKFFVFSFFLFFCSVLFAQFSQHQLIIDQPYTAPALIYGHDFEVIDWNEDGLKDIVFTNVEGSELAWHENLGSGQFAASVDIGDFVTPSDFEFVDLDGDNDLDLVANSYVSYQQDYVNIRERIGMTLNTVDQFSYTSNQGQVKTGDFDNDGDMDFVTRHHGQGMITLFRNQGSLVFVQDTLYETTNFGPIDVGDVTGNGFLDVIFSAYDSAYVIENIDGINFAPNPHGVHQMESIRPIILNDIDGDGDLDISYSGEYQNNGKIVTFYNNGTLDNWSEITYNMTNVNRGELAQGDLNNDGKIDWICADESDVTLDIDYYENLGGGVFNPTGIVLNDALPSYADAILVKLNDLDQDGDLDVIYFSEKLNGIFWVENLLYSPIKVHGDIFYDYNQNGVKDSIDLGYSMRKVISNGYHTYSTDTGSYFLTLDTGNFYVTPNQIPGYHITNPFDTLYTTLSFSNPVVFGYDFGFYPDSIFTLLDGEILNSPAVCDNNTTAWLNITNTGTSITKAIIKYEINDSISLLGSSLPYDSLVNNTCYWHIDTFLFGQFEQIKLDLLMPNFQSMGDTLQSKIVCL